MAEEKGYVQYNITNKDTGEVDYHIFSRSGDKRTQGDFESAFFNEYLEGKKPKDFIVLSSKGLEGIQSSVRSGFEKVRGAVGSELENVDKGYTEFLNKIRGIIGKDPISQEDLLLPAKGLTENIIKTPEDLGMLLGLFVAGRLTQGVSGALPIAKRVLGGVLGVKGTELLSGEAQQKRLMEHVGSTLTSAMVVAIPEGASGVVARVLGKNLSRRAQQQVSEDIMSLMKDKYPQLANQGVDGFKALASTEEGLMHLTRIGQKALREDNITYVNNLLNNIQQSTPRAFSKAEKSSFENLFVKLVNQSDEYLESTSSKQTKEAAIAVNKTFGEIKDKILEVFPNMKKDKYNNIIELLTEYSKHIQSFTEGAEVINALKNATTPKGFNVRKFQEYVAERTGSKLFEGVATAAGRGVRGGVDESLSMNVPFTPKIPMLGRFSVSMPTGTKYAGNVKGLIPDVAPVTSVSINSSIREYFKEK